MTLQPRRPYRLRYLYFFSILTGICLSAAAIAQPAAAIRDSFNLLGIVKDTLGEPLQGATVSLLGTPYGMATDINGFFRFRLPADRYDLEISYVGYRTQALNIALFRNHTLVLRMENTASLLEEVEITDRARDYQVRSLEIGVNKLSTRALQQIPTLLGEVDVVRSLQTLPGVTTVGEGATGFNVRGGNIDQNLALMDEIVLFNTAHLMGLFSVFHPDAVRDVTFIRGGIPAKYGGKASSVLDVQLRDPEAGKPFKINAGLGLVSSRLSTEGYLVPDRLSLLVAGRYAYPEYLFRLLPDENIRQTSAGFYDLTARMKWQAGAKDQLWFTAYFSRDRFKIAGDSLTGLEVNASSSLFRWQTSGASLRWRHLANEHFSWGLIGAWTDYRPGFSIPDDAFAAEFKSGVRQGRLRGSASYLWENNQLEGGLELTLHQVDPGSLLPGGASSAVNPVVLDQEQALEAAVYLQGEWNISERLGISYGLRYSHFSALGPSRVLDYQPGQARDFNTVVDTSRYSGGDTYATYQGPEPRLAIRFAAGKAISVKLGYQRMRQYLHLISNTTAALPTDRWKISDPYTQPQVADQLSLGYFHNFLENSIETSVEFFAKQVQGQPDFRSGVNLLLLDATETAILQGEGRSYGVELLFRKTTGRLNGWLSYTLSRSVLRVESPYPEDAFFSGQWYAANFDRPQVLNAVLSYRITPRISVSANFNYSAGRPVTYPESKFYVSGVYVPNFTTRNDARIPAYHRLDASVTFEPQRGQERKFSGRWTLSVYNLYSRRNAYSVFFRTENDNFLRASNRANAYRLAIIGTIVPSLTYDFSF